MYASMKYIDCNIDNRTWIKLYFLVTICIVSLINSVWDIFHRVLEDCQGAVIIRCLMQSKSQCSGV